MFRLSRFHDHRSTILFVVDRVENNAHPGCHQSPLEISVAHFCLRGNEPSWIIHDLPLRRPDGIPIGVISLARRNSVEGRTGSWRNVRHDAARMGRDLGSYV